MCVCVDRFIHHTKKYHWVAMDSVTGRGSHAAAGAGVDSNSQGTNGLASDEKIMSDRIDGSA